MTETVTLSYTSMLADLPASLPAELGLTPEQLTALAQQLDQGATPVYLTRYRPDLLPGAVSLTQIRRLLERLNARADLTGRRERIIETIRRQGQLTENLLTTLTGINDRIQLEDYYLPYRPKRKSLSQQAIDAGLLPFAEQILSEPVNPVAALGHPETAPVTQLDNIGTDQDNQSRPDEPASEQNGSAASEVQTDASVITEPAMAEGAVTETPDTENAGTETAGAETPAIETPADDQSDSSDVAQSLSSPDIQSVTTDSATGPESEQASEPQGDAVTQSAQQDQADPSPVTHVDAAGLPDESASPDSATPEPVVAQTTSAQAPETKAQPDSPATSPMSSDPADGRFWHESYPDPASQLAGIQHILLARWLRQPELIAAVRERFGRQVFVRSVLAHNNKPKQAARYREFHDFREALDQVRTGQMLALLTGQREGLLTVTLEGDEDAVLQLLNERLGTDQVAPAERRQFLMDTVKQLWQNHLRAHIEKTLLSGPQQAADRQALRLVSEQIQQRLNLSGAGQRVVMAIHPSVRMGSRVAVIGRQGEVLAHHVIYPLPPRDEKEAALTELASLCREHGVELIAVGNSPACRELMQLVAQLQKANPDLSLARLLVNEQGANTYAGSEAAATELPDLEPPTRVAVWIGRYVQQPLAELSRLETRGLLGDLALPEIMPAMLDRAVAQGFRDLIVQTGVDVNRAPASLLALVPGLDRNLGQQIVNYRQDHGPFTSREALQQVPRLGNVTFEQAAPFLMITDQAPLDQTAIHPQHYALVQRIAEQLGLAIPALLADSSQLAQLDPASLTDEQTPLPVVEAVIQLLRQPPADPRPPFRTAQFRQDITDASQLQPGEVIEGMIVNTMSFGAFVDIGLPQDGLVHISELSDQFVSDVSQLVKPGQIVQARVLEMDGSNNRVALSLKGLLPQTQKPREPRPSRSERSPRSRGERPRQDSAHQNSARQESTRQDNNAPQDNAAQAVQPDTANRPARPQREGGERRNRPPADRAGTSRRDSRPGRDNRDNPRHDSNHPSRPPRQERTDSNPATAPENLRQPKLGSLGALLQQAGLKRPSN